MFCVTGALGCIGSWTVKRLNEAGAPVVACDLPGDTHRWRLIDPDLERKVPIVDCDITDRAALQRLLSDHGVTHVVHLAALQGPSVRGQPALGAHVNVEGMAAVLEAAASLRDHVRGVAFASSVAVYGPVERYPVGPLAHDAAPHPTSLYGAYKLANEWMSRAYEHSDGVVSIGLRPTVVYGPGRDQGGATASPTLAMLAAAVSRPYHIGWGGIAGYQHARDVADAFIAAARACEDGGGSETYSLPAHTCSVESVIAAIQQVVGGTADITHDASRQLPFPAGFDSDAVRRRLPTLTQTPLIDGVRDTIETFATAAAAGRLDVDRLMSGTGRR
jgi:UDP-glucuronate 4-epimerase